MMQYIYDFLSTFFDKLKEKDKIKSIILYGSFARGNSRKDSDIDIFIDVLEKDKEEIEEIVKEALNEFELKASRTWHLKAINNPISPIVDSLNLSKWSELRMEMANYSILLYGKYISERIRSKHKIIIEYDLSKSKQKDKMKVLRKLYGYQIKKGKKVYSQEGIVDSIKYEKLGNALIADVENYRGILNLLKEYKIPVKLRPFWLG